VKNLNNSKHIVFTSVNLNYLGRALTLARSVKNHDPEVYFVLLLVEPTERVTHETKKLLIDCDGGQTFDEVLTLTELDLPDSIRLRDYSVVEMCTAVKGLATLNLLFRDFAEYVTYLDPDLFFYNSLEDIRAAHLDGEVLLTPHLNHVPFMDQTIHNDEIAGVLRHGIFNLGFISFKKSRASINIAAWWADRLAISAKADYSKGLFTDQKWWDLSQVYFKDVKVIKNDGWNMAPWNISERRLTSLNPKKLESGECLLFFHFSKYPSRDFEEKIKSQFRSKFLDEVISEYGKYFEDSERYSHKLISEMYVRNQDFRNFLIPTPKRSPGIEILVTKTMRSSANNRFVRKIILRNSRIKKLAKCVYSLGYNFLYRLEKFNASENASLILNKMNLDVLIISHKGGGGVSVVVNERVREYLSKGLTVGILSPDTTYNLKLSIPSQNIIVKVNHELKQLLSACAEIEIHHILGMEKHLDLIAKNKIHRIFLHDKYFLSQTPFSDTEKYIKVPSGTAGINLPLTGIFQYIESEWQVSTGRLLQNAEKIFAPSTYIIDSYLSVFPKIKIERNAIEPGSLSYPASLKSDQINSIILISPTGIHKGSSVLIEIAKLLEEAKPSLNFKIFGDLDLYSREGLSPLGNVQLYGQISRNRLNYALRYSMGSLGWIPSLTGESYSLALTDFISNGIPVIAAKTGALPERLRSVPGNYLYDPNTPISDLVMILIALVENKNVDDFSQFVEMT